MAPTRQACLSAVVAVMGCGNPLLVDANERPEDACSALMHFANSVSDAHIHAVTLQILRPRNTIECVRAHLPQEEELCAWLLDKTSSLSMYYAIVQVVRCMGHPSLSIATAGSTDGAIRNIDFPATGITLGMSFHTDPGPGLSWLRIEAFRFTQ